MSSVEAESVESVDRVEIVERGEVGGEAKLLWFIMLFIAISLQRLSKWKSEAGSTWLGRWRAGAGSGRASGEGRPADCACAGIASGAGDTGR